MCDQVRSYYPISSSVEKKKNNNTKYIKNLLLGYEHKTGPKPHTPTLPEEVELRGQRFGLWSLTSERLIPVR